MVLKILYKSFKRTKYMKAIHWLQLLSNFLDLVVLKISWVSLCHCSCKVSVFRILMFISFFQVVWSNHINRSVTFSSVELLAVRKSYSSRKWFPQRSTSLWCKDCVSHYIYSWHITSVIIMVILRPKIQYSLGGLQ